jgi:hypothetical protein
LKKPTADFGDKKIHTLHEVKRARVLAVGTTLETMYSLAESSWVFRENGKQCFRGNALLCQVRAPLLGMHHPYCAFQAIDELAIHEVRHIVLTTETHYALVYLGDDCQLYMSSVYQIRQSPTQAADMARLVLFYAHAMLSEPLTLPPTKSVLIRRVEVPSFPPSIFKPYKGKIFLGKGIRSVKYSPMQRPSRWWISPFIPLKVEGYAEESRHEGDIRITFIKLIFMIFQRSAVAKAAYGLSASARIIHEFDVYNALRALQGRSIPTLFGLYRSEENGSGLVLVTSYEGRALPSFDDLRLQDRFVSLPLANQCSYFWPGTPYCRASSVFIKQALSISTSSLEMLFCRSRGVPSSLILTARRSTTVAEAYLAANFVRWLDAWESISVS